MFPHTIFGVPPFLFLLPIASAVGLWVFLLGARRSGIPEYRALQMQLLVSVAGLIGAKGFSLIFEFGWNPFGADEFEGDGGWRYPGGLVAIVIATPMLRRWLLPDVSLARYADLLAPVIAVAFGLMRVHCILLGCCVGGQCTEFFCVSYAPGSVVAHSHSALGLTVVGAPSLEVLPLHALFMAASLAVAAAVWRFDPHRQYDGQVFLLYLLLHESLKFSLELLREPPSALLQGSSLILALSSFALLVWVGRRRKREAAGARTA